MTAKSIFISGGSGGIGLATADLFAERGWRVGIADVNAGSLSAALATRAHLDIAGIPLDVRAPASWEAALAAFCEKADGALDTLVNCAGTLDYGWFDEQAPEAIIRMVEVNVIGVLLGARTGAAHLAQSNDGCLINIASAAGFFAVPRLAAYSATKFAARGLSEALDLEFGRIGVRVACISPTPVDTGMLDATSSDGVNFRAASANMTLLEPRDVAETVWAAAHGGALHYPLGERTIEVAAESTDRIARSREYWRAQLTAAAN